MIDDQGNAQQVSGGGESIFVVRLPGGGDEFAVCERVGTVPGSRHLPGSGRTVAELVAEQALLAAAVSEGDEEALDTLVFTAQSGQNALEDDD